LVNPLFGNRLWMGICPPSYPGLTPPPDRLLKPFDPLPAVFPEPEATPRPTRLRGFFDPICGDNSLSFIYIFLGLHKMRYGINHSPN
jgi:hypothetical protein